MANEATAITLLGNGGDPLRYTCADGTGISAGTLLHIQEPMTVAKSSIDGEYFAGIAAADKEASDGATTISAYTNGVFDVRFGGGAAISAGQLVKLSGANLVSLADDDTVENSQQVVGVAMEDTAAGTAETIAVKIRV